MLEYNSIVDVAAEEEAAAAAAFSADAVAAFSADAAPALSAAAVILFHTHVLISGVFSDRDLYMYDDVPLYHPFINHDMMAAVVGVVSNILYLILGYPHVVFLCLWPAYKRYVYLFFTSLFSLLQNFVYSS